MLDFILTPPLLTTGDWGAALAGFLAVGISLCGALAFGRRWWPAYLIIASAVLLVRLLAPYAYTAFGPVFEPVASVGLAGALFCPSLRRPAPSIALGVPP